MHDSTYPPTTTLGQSILQHCQKEFVGQWITDGYIVGLVTHTTYSRFDEVSPPDGLLLAMCPYKYLEHDDFNWSRGTTTFLSVDTWDDVHDIRVLSEDEQAICAMAHI